VVNDFFELKAQLSMQGKQTLLTYAYRQTSGGDPNNLAEILNDSWAALIPFVLMDMLGTDVQLQCIYSRRVQVAPGIPCTLNFSNAFGNGLQLSYPANSPFVLKITTDANSSRQNGRQYISGASNDFITDGALTAPFIATELDAYETAYLAPITGPLDPTVNFESGIISRFSTGVKRPTPLFAKAVDATSDTFVKGQKLRRTLRTMIGFP